MSSVRVGWIEAFVVLDEHEYIVLFGGFKEGLVVCERLYGRLGDQHVNSALDGIEGYWIVGGVWSENGDGITRRKGVNCSLVSIAISDIIGWI